jgi:hypothetical protein
MIYLSLSHSCFDTMEKSAKNDILINVRICRYTIEFQELSCTKIVSIEACGYYINQL